jgi:TolA-binding protein
MKRSVLVLMSLFAWRLAGAQEPATGPAPDATAAALARQDAEERTKRLSADVQSLLDTQELIQKRQEDIRQRLDKLEVDLRSLKDDQSRASKFATQDELRKFVEKLKEVDEKRDADNKLILEKIKELAKVPVAVAPPVEESHRGRGNQERGNPERGGPETASEEAPFVYKIQKNDQLYKVVAEYNKEFQKKGWGRITLDQVLKANPDLKPNRLIVGKTILIPVPAKEPR